MPIDPRQDPHARIVVKPLPSQRGKEATRPPGRGAYGAQLPTTPSFARRTRTTTATTPTPTVPPSASPCSWKTPGTSLLFLRLQRIELAGIKQIEQLLAGMDVQLLVDVAHMGLGGAVGDD